MCDKSVYDNSVWDNSVWWSVCEMYGEVCEMCNVCNVVCNVVYVIVCDKVCEKDLKFLQNVLFLRNFFEI